MSDELPPNQAASAPDPEPLPEPSVLDYVKSKLSFRREGQLEIPAPVEGKRVSQPPQAAPEEAGRAVSLPWRSLLALILALIAQRSFEPPLASALSGIAFYIAALGLLLWAILRREWTLEPLEESPAGNDPGSFYWVPFLLSILLLVPAFILLGGGQITSTIVLPQFLVDFFHLKDNLFSWYNVLIWLATIGCLVGSLWLYNSTGSSIWQRIRAFFVDQKGSFVISPWIFLILAATVLVVFFRVYHIQQTPAEPFSDHAEKALDLFDISQGWTRIFFPRNTGREAIGMYWLILTEWIFGTGITFLTMKIGTVLMGLFTLPFVYLLGKEIANRRAGLLAFVLVGIGYWPNVISRIGLRFPLYPLFTAPTLLYLIRGLRHRNRNDFILAGIFLGLDLQGYTPARIVPFLVVVAFGLFLLHAQSKGLRRDTLIWLILLTLVSVFVFLPLLRYASEYPAMFSFRALSRVENIEQPLPGPWYQIFFLNLWNALKMFNVDDGNIWVNSLPHRPALDIVTGALFLIGVVLVLVRYIQRRHWLDLFLLLSVPILQLPSILSLAYPGENPALNRSAAAYIPAFLLAAIALDSLMTAVERIQDSRLSKGITMRLAPAWLLSAALILWSGVQSFDIVFHQFDQNYRNGAWNSSEMGAVIKNFDQTYGETETVWIVPFPFWVDTRLPGVWAGIPNRDFAIWPDHLGDTLQYTGPKLFIVKASLQDPNANDQQTLNMLKILYPQGTLNLHKSSVPGHDFWIFFVPGSSTSWDYRSLTAD